MCNGYDAGARQVRVLLPEPAGDGGGIPSPLWVLDDGHGMDAAGFLRLWRVAWSNKTDMQSNGRAPIGQFGIGKLAAYVLAWRLTHLSHTDGELLLTAMNFRRVTARQTDDAGPMEVSLRKVDEAWAREFLGEIHACDPGAWEMLFGDRSRTRSWTVAALTEFKSLYDKLSAGRLRWVLGTGLSLHANFGIWLDGERVTSSKERLPEISGSNSSKNFRASEASAERRAFSRGP